MLNRILFSVAAAAVTFIAASDTARACWCSRAYTASYYDPCVACPTVARSYYVPVDAPVVAACPTTSCSTVNVQRCYYEPQTVYQTQTVLEPQVSYVRRSYYDPLTCCYQSYLVPTTQYVQRSYQVPVTSWSKRCATEPVQSCTTTYTASYFVPQTYVSSYWSPNGVAYYRSYYPATTIVAPTSCPAPSGNGATQRESGYGPTDDSKKSEPKPANEAAPTPTPMPKPAPGAGGAATRARPGVAVTPIHSTGYAARRVWQAPAVR
jgi:hypothetical protein